MTIPNIDSGLLVVQFVGHNLGGMDQLSLELRHVDAGDCVSDHAHFHAPPVVRCLVCSPRFVWNVL